MPEGFTAEVPSISMALGVIALVNRDLPPRFRRDVPHDLLQLRKAHCTASPGLLILRQERYRRRRSLNSLGSLRGSKAIWIAMRRTPYMPSSTIFQTRPIG